jgi:phage terminase small subunit
MDNKKLTLKQRAYAEKYVEMKNGTEAAWRTYSCKNKNSAAVMANKLNDTPKVRREIERVLEEHQLTEDVVVQRLREGLDATQTAVCDGEVIESTVPDMAVRHKYVQEAAKIMDLYPPERSESRNINVDMQLERLSPKQIEALLKGMLSEINGKPNYQEKLGDPIGSPENAKEEKSTV